MAVAIDQQSRLTRRALLLGFAVAGCSRVLVADIPSQDVTPPPLVAANVLKVVFFELGTQGLPYHTALIIHTPHTRLILDPLGKWETDQCRRDGDVLRNPTPEVEALYLRREGLVTESITNAVHVFEIAVSAETADRAIALAEASMPNLPLHCAKEVSTILAQLPGFEFIDANIVPADLYRALRARPDFSYTRRAIL